MGVGEVSAIAGAIAALQELSLALQELSLVDRSCRLIAVEAVRVRGCQNRDCTFGFQSLA
jgi:uncharacterized lipoprotein YbaY